MFRSLPPDAHPLERLVRYSTWGAAGMALGIVLVLTDGAAGIGSWVVDGSLAGFAGVVLVSLLWNRRRFSRALAAQRDGSA